MTRGGLFMATVRADPQITPVDVAIFLSFDEYGPVATASPTAVFWRFDPQDAVVRFDHATFDTVGAPEPLMTLPAPGVVLQTAPPLEDATWTALIARHGRLELRDQTGAVLTQVALTLTLGDARPHPGCIE